MKLVFLGLSITSSWGNGHATTYRSLIKGLSSRGHQVHFVEKFAAWYQDHRDCADISYCTLHLYEEWGGGATELLGICFDADAVIVGSYFPDAIKATLLLLDAGTTSLFFYDIDTPVTLAGLRKLGRTEYLEASLIPHYAAYLSFSGGPVLEELEQKFGSPWACAFYCSVDPDVYTPSAVRSDFICDLSYLGTYAPDRQARLEEFLQMPAQALPSSRFTVAGSQYPKEQVWSRNVSHFTHVAPAEHPHFYSSSRFTLNVTRSDMVIAGFSPSVRLFEASACGTAILSDRWAGLEMFLTPGEEVLTPKDAAEVVEILTSLSDEERVRMGARARTRILAEHTATHRARQLEQIISDCSGTRSRTLLGVQEQVCKTR